MSSETLRKAKAAKNDEFYTQYSDIQNEVNAYVEYNPNVFKGKTILCPCDDPTWSKFTEFFADNFESFGLKKLIGTSYAFASKNLFCDYEPNEKEKNSPQYDESKSKTHGKKYVLYRDVNGDGKIDYKDIEWDYMDGDGDFRSDEVKALFKEADIIITNPPFSLFREFLAQIMDFKKKFLIIANVGAIGYKEVFKLIKDNKIWLGKGFANGNAYFGILNKTEYADGVYDEKTGLVKFRNCCWLTNLEHNKRHEPLDISPMEDVIKYNKKMSGQSFLKYDNYDAIDVPAVSCIPSDYKGIMGVPVTFLDSYCPEQFEIIGSGTGDNAKEIGVTKNYRGRTDLAITKDGKSSCPYQRILIRHKNI